FYALGSLGSWQADAPGRSVLVSGYLAVGPRINIAPFVFDVDWLAGGYYVQPAVQWTVKGGRFSFSSAIAGSSAMLGRSVAYVVKNGLPDLAYGEVFLEFTARSLAGFTPR